MSRIPAFLLAALLASGCTEELEDEPPEQTLVCDRSSDLLLAPPPTELNGGGPRVAPVDLLALDAELVISETSQDVAVTATVSFLVGEAPGLPILQWAGTPLSAELDGEELTATDWIQGTVGSIPQSVFALDRQLERCSEHSLQITARITPEQVETGELPRLRFRPDGVWHSSALEDGLPDRYLGLWMPSNLLFDPFPLTLELGLEGSTAAHHLVANGDVSALAEDRWRIEFPAHFTAHSPFWVLFPEDAAEQLTATASLSAGPVEVEVWRLQQDEGIDLADARDRIVDALEAFDATYGSYVHGERYLAWMRSDLDVSMEYDGATLSVVGAVRHEVFHSWWARGLAPLSDHHGWLDEGITTWVTAANPELIVDLEVGEPLANLMIGEDEWTGAGLNPLLYAYGANVFGGLAGRFGLDPFRDSLRRYFEQEAPAPMRTQDLERWLTCDFEDTYPRDVFWSHVYQEEGFPPPPEADYCP